MLEEFRIRILGYSNASNPISVHQQIENQKMLRIEFWTSDFESKSAQNDPRTLIIRFTLKDYAQKWSQIVKTLDGCPQNDDFGIFVRSERTGL